MEGRIKEVLLWPISSLGDIKEAISYDKNWLALLPVVGAGVAVYATGVHTQPTMALAKTYGMGAVGYMAGLVTYGAIVQNERKHMKYAPGPMKSKLPPNWQHGPDPIFTHKPPTYAPFPGLQPVHQQGHGPVKVPHRDLSFWGDMERAATAARHIYNVKHGGLSNTPPNWPPGK